MGMDKLFIWVEHNLGSCQLAASLTLPSKAQSITIFRWLGGGGGGGEREKWTQKPVNNNIIEDFRQNLYRLYCNRKSKILLEE